MTGLIPLTEHDGAQAVLGRDLHEFLAVTTPYDKWFPRMVSYGFEEDKDFSTKMSESTGGRPRTDHIVTLDMAKELSMIQRTEKGKQARQYFIECERRAKAQVELTGPELMAKALVQADSTIKELEARATTAEAIVEAAAPALEYHEKYIREDVDVITVDDFAREHGTTGYKVRAMLTELDIAFRRRVGSRWSASKNCMVDEFEWRAYAGKASNKWFDLRPQHNAPRLHNGQVKQTMYVKAFYAPALAKRLGLSKQTSMEVAQ
ncbi:hypothetical protein CPHO_08535 [Corynebacterium phocae]|uniref:AntA/AntB antirepressor domain-containing protein n=1 Tax=Corynebacterium phocae TaxID=161895 RepID=A0A1L7D493_9CORY|nr:antA/AntB antirepressor family protein [Corynebacterium phocae]APT92925.1 hypothetical protein CPHO_08535 [Corynebacterium phocae]KAA8723255.1 phage antirepressor Ant [Corynebacterium phocae]